MHNKYERKVVVITGATTGIGNVVAKMLANQDYKVYSLSRKKVDDNKIKFIECDVTNEEQVDAAFQQIFAMENRIDVVINNSGFGISGPLEENDINNFYSMLNVNICGLYNVTFNAIKYLTRSKGIVFMIGSMAGVFSVPFQAGYSISKKAVDTIVCSLYKELKAKDIRICNIMPGDTKTNFTSNRIKQLSNSYEPIATKAVEKMERDELKGRNPKIIGNIILKNINKKKPPLRIAVGFEYKLLTKLQNLLPEKIVYSLLYSMYCK